MARETAGSVSTSGGDRRAAARSSAELIEAARGLPEMARTLRLKCVQLLSPRGTCVRAARTGTAYIMIYLDVKLKGAKDGAGQDSSAQRRRRDRQRDHPDHRAVGLQQAVPRNQQRLGRQRCSGAHEDTRSQGSFLVYNELSIS